MEAHVQKFVTRIIVSNGKLYCSLGFPLLASDGSRRLRLTGIRIARTENLFAPTEDHPLDEVMGAAPHSGKQ